MLWVGIFNNIRTFFPESPVPHSNYPTCAVFNFQCIFISAEKIGKKPRNSTNIQAFGGCQALVLFGTAETPVKSHPGSS